MNGMASIPQRILQAAVDFVRRSPAPCRGFSDVKRMATESLEGARERASQAVGAAQEKFGEVAGRAAEAAREAVGGGQPELGECALPKAGELGRAGDTLCISVICARLRGSPTGTKC